MRWRRDNGGYHLIILERHSAARQLATNDSQSYSVSEPTSELSVISEPGIDQRLSVSGPSTVESLGKTTPTEESSGKATSSRASNGAGSSSSTRGLEGTASKTAWRQSVCFCVVVLCVLWLVILFLFVPSLGTATSMLCCWL